MGSNKEEEKRDRENDKIAIILTYASVCFICFLTGLSFNTSSLCNLTESATNDWYNITESATNDWYNRTFEILSEYKCSFISTSTHRNYSNRRNEYTYLYCNQHSCVTDGYCKDSVVSLEALRNNVTVR